jgi:hypothetical protein
VKSPRHWTPLTEIPPEGFKRTHSKVIEATMAHYGYDEPTARAFLDDYHSRCRFFVNELYQVMVEEYHPGCLHLNIRRRDGGMVKDWRHFQQIKNEIAGPEREAVELYPAESRKVDTSNKWHLWVQPPGVTINVGWEQRDVTYDENRDVPGMRQRPL